MSSHWLDSHWYGVDSAAGTLTEPTLAVADNGNDTGATATITGSDSNATNTVYVQAFDDELGTTTWTASGSRTGNGTVSLTLAAGHYFAYVLSELADESVASSVVYFVVTTGNSAVHDQCLVAAQARIQALTLAGITSSNIIIRKIPTDRDIGGDGTYDFPAIVISPLGIENQPPSGGTNARDDVGYPVLISFLAADNQDLTTNRERYLKWRETVNRAFRSQRLTGVSEVYICRVQPGPIVSPAAFWKNVYHSSLLVQCISRETRGF